jgi:hypothetical protein
MHDDKESRYILDISTPTPSRFYYQKPFWWAIFESGWHDFAVSIPEFKKAIMQNGMTLRYHVEIARGYFEKKYTEAGITDAKKKAEYKTEWLTKLNETLSGAANAKKSIATEFEYDRVKGGEIHDVIIKPIDTSIKGGEYIEDIDEANNMVCYAMGVHPSLIGAAPGKNKNINGTEARELFIIKQAQCKPVRDMITLPLQLVQRVNGWDKDLQFVIANTMLTTLDANTGAVKSIGQERI